MKILLVERDAITRLFAPRSMENAGHIIFTADTKEEAFKLLDLHADFELAIIDLFIDHVYPDEGIEILRRTRVKAPAARRWVAVPYVDDQIIARCMLAGADAVFLKQELYGYLRESKVIPFLTKVSFMT